MKKFYSAILVAGVSIFLAGLSWSQSFRGPRGGTANAWNFGGGGLSQRSAHQFGSFQSPVSGPSSFHFSSSQTRGEVIVKQGAPFLAPPRRLATPGSVPRHAPGHLHHGHHFPKSRGILIIEVPRVYGPTVTVTTVPGVTQRPSPTPITPSGEPWGRGSGLVAPFDPTPQEVVERMLALAEVKQGDLVYDLGSGDGRVVVAAAKKYGAQAVGVEIDAGLVKLARENVRREGVEDLVEIRQQDLMTADLSMATVVMLHLSEEGNLALRPKLMRELRLGSRVVSYRFGMGDWPPKIIESYRDAANDMHTLYFWKTSSPLASYEAK